jgi:hypothetical protein
MPAYHWQLFLIWNFLPPEDGILVRQMWEIRRYYSCTNNFVHFSGEINWEYSSRKCIEWTVLNLWQKIYSRRAKVLEKWRFIASSDFSVSLRETSNQTCRIPACIKRTQRDYFLRLGVPGYLSLSVSRLRTGRLINHGAIPGKGKSVFFSARHIGGPWQNTQLAIVKGGHFLASRAVGTWSWPLVNQCRRKFLLAMYLHSHIRLYEGP